MKYKPTYNDIASEGGIAKLKHDGFKRHEIMGAIHNHTRGIGVDEKRKMVRNLMKQEDRR